MKVLIVCNNAYLRGNGICTAVLSLVRRLKERGVEARIMACENPDPSGPQPEYPLKHFKIPFFESIIDSNGFMFAKFDEETATQAIKWADVIHLSEGFPLEAQTVRLAKKLGVPCVGTYHLLTENITANLGLGKSWLLNHLLTLWWRKSVYDHCTYVHCPTEMVRRYLTENGFKSELRVISNGIDIPKLEAPQFIQQGETINILCVGRLAREKSQDTLLKAMRHSKYADRIQLHFAGKGPFLGKYKRMADDLLHDGVIFHTPIFAFHTHEELKELTRNSYLYIHCAWVEVEGLSCAEALLEGAVPVIADGRLTASSQFALDDRSIFPEFNEEALAERIDWWIEHPQERIEMGSRYAQSIMSYDSRSTTSQMIRMYEDCIRKGC